MKAMILAGGMSTRLYPLTRQVPKALVPIAGLPNAVHVIHYLKRYGFDEIAINVHYLADAIVAALGDGSRFGVRLEYLHEPELLGSAGAVKQMERFFGNDVFAVVGCDDLTDLPLDRLVAFHRERNAVATIGLVERDDVSQYGVVAVDATGRITGFQEKPTPGTELSHRVNTGIYAFSPAIFRHIPDATFYDFGKQVFPALQQAQAAFYGYDARNSYWCDIGTPDEYRRASFDVVRGVLRIPDSRGSGMDPTARIAASAIVEGNVWIGAGTRIGEGVRIIGPSVIGDGTRIDAHASLERSIIWDSAIIGEHATLTGAIVGNAFEIASGAVVTGEIVAND